MSALKRVPAVLILACVPGCGGGPTEPVTPTPAPSTDVHTVNLTILEDENRNGRIDGDENEWIPEVEVEIGGRTGKSERRSGRVTVANVPRGTYTLNIRANSLPPYYQAGAAVTVEVPPAAGSDIKVPVVLPLGSGLTEALYFASGDSISQGESSTSGLGFRQILQDRLLDYFGRGRVVYRGGGGGRTLDGALRLDRDMDNIRPAYTMINWGVNDYLEPGCSNPANTDCALSTNLRSMVRTVRNYGSLPILVTITPANVGYDEKAPASRNTWVRSVNDIIRNLGRTERVLVIDVGDAFFKQPSLSSLFVDHVHPNDAGYQIMADVYFQALTHGTIAQ